jgi:hypothetical protein
MEGAQLDDAHLEKARLLDAHLTLAHLSHAHLERAILAGANLKAVEFYGAHLGAFFSGANLEWAGLASTNLVDIPEPHHGGRCRALKQMTEQASSTRAKNRSESRS